MPIPRVSSVRRSRGIRAAVEPLEWRRLLSVNVLTWHDDLTRQGLNNQETQLTPADVNSGSFGKLFSYPVDGQVYAQPLYVAGLNMGALGTHDVVFVATQHDSVYAFDADNSNPATGGGLLWHVSLGTSAAMPNQYFANRYGPYHDIDPEVGITGTPVIDLAGGTLYVDAFTNDATGVYSHHVHALDITSGADKVTPVLVTATYPGNSVEGNGTTLTFAATQQLQRPALTLLNGTLYVTYGSFADTDPYHGWILGFDPSTLQLRTVFNTTPNLLNPQGANPGEGAIWQAGAGLASDGSNLFFETGNGDFGTQLNAQGLPANGDYGDSFVKLSTANSTLTVSDYFTPSNQQALANADEDLGSGGLMLLPASVGSAAHPNLLIGSGKQGVAYLIDAGNMGHFSASKDNVVQKVNLGGGTFSSPAYFNGHIYYRGGGTPLQSFSIANGVMSTTPVAKSSGGYSNEGGATPSISSNGNTAGIVWDIQNNGSAVLHAYDASNLQELYNSNQMASRDGLGGAVKFTTPAIADGKVFVGTANAVAVFGLLPPPTQPPAAPSGLSANPVAPTQVLLQWTTNSANQSGFKIERSTDGVSFVQIALAGASATSYLDTSASPGGTYSYRIRATNAAGDSSYSNVAGPVTTPLTLPQNDIGVNFATGQGGTFPLAPTDVAGVVPIAHWNNLTGATGNAGGASGSAALTASSGAATGVSVAWQANNNWDAATQEDHTDQFPANSGDYTLMAGYLDDKQGSAPATSQSFGTGSLNGNGILFSNLTAPAYDVYVYTLQSVIGRSGTITVSGGTSASQAAMTSGTYSSYVAGQDYLVFPDVQPAAGGKLLITPDGTSFRIPFQGIELIPTPAAAISDAAGGSTIRLIQDPDHNHVDWTIGSQSGRVLLSDPRGLTITDGGATPDTIVLDSTNGNPLPALLSLSGSFTVKGFQSLPAGGTIDLNKSTVTIPYSGASPLSTLQGYLASGRIHSSATGNGFAISDTDANGAVTLGYDRVGDLNRDGKVNFADLLLLAQHYNQSGQDWAAGDLNYDGSVGFADLLLLAQHYGGGTTVQPAADLLSVLKHRASRGAATH